jgi:hypothetical protein
MSVGMLIVVVMMVMMVVRIVVVADIHIAQKAVDATMSIGHHGMDIFMSFAFGIVSLSTFGMIIGFRIISSSRRSISNGKGSRCWTV